MMADSITGGKMDIDIRDNNQFKTIIFNETSLCIPSQPLVDQLHEEGADELRKHYAEGVYTRSNGSNTICKTLLEFFKQKLEKSLAALGSRELLATALTQRDCCQKFSEMIIDESTESATRILLENLDLHVRARSLKHIAENCVLLQNEIAICSGEGERLRHYAMTFATAYETVRLSTLSDRIEFNIFADEFLIELPPSGQLIFQDPQADVYSKLKARQLFDTKMGDEIFKDGIFSLDMAQIETILDAPMKDEIGMNFRETVELMAYIDTQSKPSSRVRYAKRDTVVKSVSEDFNIAPNIVDRVLAGLSLNSRTMKEEQVDRLVYDAQLEHRALRRCFFEIPWDGETHIAWTDLQFMDTYTSLQNFATFGKFPSEWETEKMRKALGRLNDMRGNWFEQQVAKQVNLLGIQGRSSCKSLGKKNSISCKSVGDLDFFGWSSVDSALVLLECKMLLWASDPTQMRNQIKNFEKYEKQLRNKSNWVIANQNQIVSALRQEGIPVGNPLTLRSILVTYEPSIASELVKEFPSVTLGEFVANFRENGSLAYESGISYLS